MTTRFEHLTDDIGNVPIVVDHQNI